LQRTRELDDWLVRFLEIELPASRPAVQDASPAPHGAPGQEPPLAIWRSAKETVDTGISELQRALRDTGHPLLSRIADQSLGAITGRLQVGLQAALMDLQAAPPDKRARARTRVAQMVEGMETFLRSNRVVPLLDDNPFGIQPQIRSTLGQALASIKSRLDAESA
jgi:hypothetical protein